jgi:hypothetical protein
MVGGDSSYLLLAALFLYVTQYLYLHSFQFFRVLFIFLAFWFQNRGYCELSQNKQSQTEGYL